MTSLQTTLKQIPLNDGYFRVVPSLIPGYGIPGVATATAPFSVSSYMYSLTNGALGPFVVGNAALQTQLSAGTCLLKDMGVNFISAGTVGTSQPQIFRRVQVVDTTAGAATNGVSGTSAGIDSDYACAYIAMGFSGAAPTTGPFIRTG
jgi:hypothetical protein